MKTLALKADIFVSAEPTGDDGDDETGDAFEIEEKGSNSGELDGDMDDAELDESEFIDESDEE